MRPRLLLDTCTLLWLAADKSRLSPRARALLTETQDVCFVSAISGLEIALRYRERLLQLPLPPADWVQEAVGFFALEEIPVSAAIAMRVALLPPRHDDLCDRTLVATALEKGLSIVTPDPLIAAYEGISVIW